MKNIELVGLWNLIDSMSTQRLKREFVFSLYENKLLIQNKIDALTEASSVVPEYQTFEAKRVKLCQDFAVKDDTGNPLTANNQFVIDDKSTFEESLTTLRSQYKDAIDLQEQRIEEVKALMEKEVEPSIKFILIDRNLFPETLTLDEVGILQPLIQPIE